MKVLILGIGQTNFLSVLYRKLKQGIPLLQCDIYGARKLDKKFEWDDQEVFHVINKFEWSIVKIAFGFFRCFFDWRYWHFIIASLVLSGSKKIFSITASYATGRLTMRALINDNRYDVFHVHFVTWQNMLLVFFLPANHKIILSFWGSDLLRISDSFSHFIVRKALVKASSITVQSIELREIILAKFGRELKEKITIAQFPLEDTIFNTIDLMDVVTARKNLNFLMPNRINVVIGHNASSFNNHGAIIESLNLLSPEMKAQLFLIIPFTYGLESGSRRESATLLKTRIEKMGINFFVIEEFLSWIELASLKLVSDVMIHLPESDALSGAMTESMYTGTVVITGSWLPYGPFRKAGITFVEIDKVSDVGNAVALVMDSLSNYKIKAEANKALVSKYFLSDNHIMEPWLNMFK